MYRFIHGYSTDEAGSWMPLEGKPTCGNPRCVELQTRIWPEMFEQGQVWADMQWMECDICATERKRRRRVLRKQERLPSEEPFLSAPYVHPYNTPKYHALQLRAIQFAQYHSRQLLWVIAQDSPQFSDAGGISTRELGHRREAWLEHHDRRTAGIMGMFPAIKGLPVRFTDTTPELS